MTERLVPPQRGDEQDLFERYQQRLRRSTGLAVNTSPDIVDDACAFAWMQLVAHQPRRETVLPWLRTVARREAIRLDRLSRHVVATAELPPARVPSGRDSNVEHAHSVIELSERLQQLPARQRELVFLQAAGWRYRELAERLGVSETRVNQLVTRAKARMHEMDVREQQHSSPRGRRLRDIETDPPPYIVASIGRPPRADAKTGGHETRREWRRLVLEIEDYRTTNHVTDRVLPLGRQDPRAQPDALQRRIAGFRRDRGMIMELDR